MPDTFLAGQAAPRHGVRLLAVNGALAIELGIEWACNALTLVSGLALLTLLSTVVVMRYGFQGGLSFAPDLSELLFAIFVMAGIAQAARRGAHVATQLLVNQLHGAARLVLVVFIHALTATAYLVLAWYALQNAVIANDQTTPVLHIPWSVGYGCLATGLVLVAACSVTAIVRQTLGDEPVELGLAGLGDVAT